MAKDLAMSYKCDAISRTDVIRLVDVDYYMDVPKLMATMRPIICYTFCPVEPAGSCDDGVYSISSNVVKVDIAGGGSYEHELWDYSADAIAADYWWGSAFYSCDYRVDSADPSRRLVMLTPMRLVYGPLGWMMPGPRLGRRLISQGKWNKTEFLVAGKGGQPTLNYVSVSMAGSTSCATVPEEILTTVVLKVKRSKESIMGNVQGVFSTLEADERYAWWFRQGKSLALHRAALITECLETYPQILGLEVSRQCLNFPSPVHYTVHNKDHMLDEPKPSMRVLPVEPFIAGASSPTTCVANDKACIKMRITDVTNTATPPKEFDTFADEFIEMVVPDHEAHTLNPVEIDEVYERQPRPTQRATLRRSWLYSAKRVVVGAFQKHECYGKQAPPRNISVMPGDAKLRGSRYMYAMAKNVFYRLRFYAFSKNPRELTKRIQEVLHDARFVIPTDFTKFDGTHSKWLASVELALLKRAFKPEYHAELEKLFWEEYNCTGFTKFGVLYKTLWSRLSGSPWTSLMNTFDNALMAYIALRTSGRTKQEAWDSLGIYGGDDGLTADVQKNLYESVCKKAGLLLKAETIPCNNPVPFLGRIWYGVWTVGLKSISDTKRQVMKLHVTPSDERTPDLVVLYRKALGFLLTDYKTPLLSHWARAIIRICEYAGVHDDDLEGHVSESKRLAARWFEQYDRSENFEPADAEAYNIVASQFECPVEHVEDLCNKLDEIPPSGSYRDCFWKAFSGDTTNSCTAEVISGGDFIAAKTPSAPETSGTGELVPDAPVAPVTPPPVPTAGPSCQRQASKPKWKRRGRQWGKNSGKPPGSTISLTPTNTTTVSGDSKC